MDSKKYLSLQRIPNLVLQIKEWCNTNFVNKSITINNKELSNNIEINLDDIGLISETWTFVLDNGTTVTKEIVVKQ